MVFCEKELMEKNRRGATQNSKPSRSGSNGSAASPAQVEREVRDVVTELDRNSSQQLYHRTLWVTMNLVVSLYILYTFSRFINLSISTFLDYHETLTS